MNINKALFQLFGANAGLTALVGRRVYGLSAPDKAVYPCVVRALFGREILEIYDTPGRTALVFSHYRFIVMSQGSATYDDAVEAADALRVSLEGYKGDFTDSDPFPTVHIDGAFLTDTYEAYDDTTQMVQVVLEFKIAHTQEIRTS